MAKILAMVTMFIACTMLAACSMFQKPDGSVVSAPDPAKIEAAAAAGAAATSVVPVWGQAIGGIILAAGTALGVYYHGKENGWTQAVGAPAQAGAAPPKVT